MAKKTTDETTKKLKYCVIKLNQNKIGSGASRELSYIYSKYLEKRIQKND